MTNDFDSDPFNYAPREEPEEPAHEPIGTCERCGQPAYVRVHGHVVCWPCGYDLAN